MPRDRANDDSSLFTNLGIFTRKRHNLAAHRGSIPEPILPQPQCIDASSSLLELERRSGAELALKRAAQERAVAQWAFTA